MPNILFASDIDGTLIRRGFFLSKENKKAIEQWRNNGNYFAVVTGRSFPMVRQCVLPLCDYFICDNGSLILDAKRNILYSRPMEKDLAQKVYDTLYSCKVDQIIVHGLKEYYTEIIGNKRFFAKEFLAALVRGGISSKKNIFQKDIYQISANLLSGCKNHPEEISKLKEMKGVNVFAGHMTVDIVSSDVNKANGLKKLSAMKSFEEIYVIGDGANDLPMIQEFNSYAMADGSRELFDYAKHKANSVADALEGLLNKV